MIKLNYANFYIQASRLEQASFNAIFLDPPYNHFGHEKKLKDVAWDNEHDIPHLGKVLKKVLSKHGYIIAFANLELAIDLIQEWSGMFRLREHFIWEKPGAMPSNQYRALRVHEFILVFMHKGAKVSKGTWHPRVIDGNPYVKRNTDLNVPIRKQRKSKFNTNSTGDRFIRSVLYFPHKPVMHTWEKENISHRTIKSVELIETLLKIYTNENDKILEPFSGSAPTAVASYLQNRNCTSFENNSVYYMEAIQRLERVKSLLDKKIDNGYPTTLISTTSMNEL